MIHLRIALTSPLVVFIFLASVAPLRGNDAVWTTEAVGQFREQFRRDAALPVRDRLLRAANVSAELRAKAVAASAEQLDASAIQISPRIAVFAKRADFRRYVTSRPWIREYWRQQRVDSIPLRQVTLDLTWPTMADQNELRQLVGDVDVDIRALAIEALATLHDPSDLALIGQALEYQTSVLPMMLPSARQMIARAEPPARPIAEPRELPLLDFAWQSSTLDNYGERALKLMTGYDITEDSLHPWIQHYGMSRESVWFWQEYYQREFDLLADTPHPGQHGPIPGVPQVPDIANRRLHMLDAYAQKRSLLRTKLAKMRPDVEAKVRLVIGNINAGGADITNPHNRFFDQPAQIQLSEDRLLGLINGQGLWPDVDWQYQKDSRSFHKPYYNRMVERIGLSAESLFQPNRRNDLYQALLRNHDRLWWSSQAALIRGISRLSPAAHDQASLNDISTREGILRNAIRNEYDYAVRGVAAEELIRLGVTENHEFLRTHFFLQRKGGVSSLQNRATIVKALGQPPLADEKLRLLLDLVEDERFDAWLADPQQSRMHQHTVMQALSDHLKQRTKKNAELQATDVEMFDVLRQELRKLLPK